MIGNPAADLSPATTDDAFDRLTINAIAVICYFAAILAHEGLGHAATTALLGGRVEQITSTSCSCDTSALTPWAARAVFAGGCIANVLTGVLALWAGRRVRREHSHARYAAWLFGHLSLFVAAGYLIAFPFLPAGDWHDFVGGLSAPVAWKVGLTLLGIAGYVTTMTHARRELEELLGGDPRARRARARALTLIPYLIGGTLETLSSVVGGGGMLTLISAAPATFGGTIGVPFAGARIGNTHGTEQSSRLMLPRAPIIIVVGLFLAIVQLFWFGPGLLHRR